ncbi:ubiquinol-cytochrome C chaperone family protein [Oceanibacterium hippocampi]|uniref:Ubiquinol-cytochrome C chaperone n=1 Tax=Oceanibacterium hippocampi TaxID=745714 RepID=A0A1Y5SR11_9PROT|nr:ubiquinol-cytochrome C chaperone family protein [Oceanibacterium hippocampi]SLN45072.1 Ubiquinol-cytochrome C chaperone [Oceanibacterium hippocampi]
MAFSNPFRKSPLKSAAYRLYGEIVEQARDPGFYRNAAVDDSVEGRFAMIVLHQFLVLRRLKGEGETAETLAQHLFDIMVDDLDRSLREMGVGDLGVGKRVKKLAQRFYGHVASYDEALQASGDAALAAALGRNLYQLDDDADAAAGSPAGPGVAAGPAALAIPAMVAYVRREAARLEGRAIEAIATDGPDFGAPPEVPADARDNG